MKAAKSKVVTSGRLTGEGKGPPARRRRVPPNPGPAAHPEPAYSLYSTDSEDQVTSLHKGLDRCAALLGGILQAENTEALPGVPRAVKGGAAKSRPSTSLGKKTIKKLPTKTVGRTHNTPDLKSRQPVQRGSGSTTPKTAHQFAAPAAHSGVKLHPSRKHPATPLRCHLPPSPGQTLQHLPTTATTPPPQPDSQAAPEAPHTHHEAECDGEEEDFVPVRDVNGHSSAADTHTAVSVMQLEPGQNQDSDSSAETEEVKVKTAQYLLGELKALITGQGSVAERLLSHLEHTVSSSLINVGGSNIQTKPQVLSLHSENTQLRRRVRILNQQLKEREKAERGQNMETLCHSEASTLQEELTNAQARLQELQDDLTELRKAFQGTQSQLTDREKENVLLKTDLEATRSKLLDSERQKTELAALAQQRLEEIGNLKRILQSQDPSSRRPVVDSSVSDTMPAKQDPAEPPTERIAQFLLSLGELEPTHTEHVFVAAEREDDTLQELRDTLSHPDVRSQRGDKPHPDQSRCLDGVQSCGRRQEELSQCEVESVWSDWSMRSGSTFTSRDEAAFRDGLAALDASIASLQKTIQLDLGR
uniref:coiled-coil domain-containing protein 14 isoform X1 n=1 Tax=Epinephelus lanceolatus TaxID=310571 RepID=UPI0014457911|nr:coiled-coil domain-containing protein 14 isoform X1 [Epinephelus lanceolatus]